jgi:hypothetical protein
MENFNEEEIQKKIEEKRKRFIENAHRALGFYDQNILTTTEEHKRKRAELMEKEFNKVFEETNKSLRRYDEEPAKPLILAASKQHPENIHSSPSEDKCKKVVMESNIAKIERRQPEIEDSLVTAEKEMELKNHASISTNMATSNTEETKATTPVMTYKSRIEKDLALEEEK